MADLSKEQIKGLALAAGIEIEEPLLSHVSYDLNAIRDLLEGFNPPGLDQMEPLPVIPPHQRRSREQS